jgi:hypothetical protein
MDKEPANQLETANEDSFDGNSSSICVEDESRLEKLGSKCQTTLSHANLVKIAQYFSKNLEISCAEVAKGSKSNHKYRYYNVYKNLLRDMKIYFKQRFVDLVKQTQKELEEKLNIRFAYSLNKSCFQIFLLQLAKELVHPQIIQANFGPIDFSNPEF